MRVALFVTCLTNTFAPRAGVAVVKVLEHLGCRVDFPHEQTCCGQPMFNTGYHDQARELARRMVCVFELAEYVVTPSGSCAAMIHDYYPQLLADDPAYAPAMRRLVDKTWEFSQFLTRVLKVDLAPWSPHWPGRVTYHYSCHLRGLGVHAPGSAPLTVHGADPTDPSRAVTSLLAQVRGLEYVPLERAGQCCGFGGTFAVKFSPVSAALAQDKADCIAVTGADTVISNETGCTMHIAGLCHRQGQDVRFKHLAEVLAESLGLLPDKGAEAAR